MVTMCAPFSRCWLFAGIALAQTSVFLIYVIQNQICITKSQQHRSAGSYDTKLQFEFITFLNSALSSPHIPQQLRCIFHLV